MHAEMLIGGYANSEPVEVPLDAESQVPLDVTLVVTSDMFSVAIRVADMNGFPFIADVTYGGRREGDWSVDLPPEVREVVEPSVPERRAPDDDAGWS